MTDRKLTDAQVEEIRKSTDTHKELAKRYGVRAKLISDIKRGWDYRTEKDRVPQPKRVIKGIDPKDRRKLTAQQVRLVRKELMLKTKIKDIAKIVGVGPNTIINIRDGVTYRDVK